MDNDIKRGLGGILELLGGVTPMGSMMQNSGFNILSMLGLTPNEDEEQDPTKKKKKPDAGMESF